ncbi:hypothetical protein RFI_08371 [Reticulomyxa filosa]|uniref:Uncharacterized protein n=1 Tax=Reticulomyxa filosa TaxID=46433 RepID=X6NRW3_RETFI|nr:hypothetical protein RFI_08371 [Reticulomyxa filosa]|eukprot:ETO28756.1 hypothetical protein RFI_08371 [Reticulomyxa filosa]
MDGVNNELWPFIRMTYPKQLKKDKYRIDAAPLNVILFHSVLLLFCIIPIDLHYLILSQISSRVGCYELLENSYSILQKQWTHHRVVTSSANDTCIVTDEVTYHTRLGIIMDYVIFPVICSNSCCIYVKWNNFLMNFLNENLILFKQMKIIDNINIKSEENFKSKNYGECIHQMTVILSKQFLVLYFFGLLLK